MAEVRIGGLASSEPDITQQLIDAATQIQRSGGGTINIDQPTASITPPGDGPLCVFRDLSGVRIHGHGADLRVARDFRPNETLDLFAFHDCTDVQVDGIDAAGTVYDGPPHRGAVLVALEGACRDVSVSARLRRFGAGLLTRGLSGSNERSSGLVVDLDTTDCLYAINCQFNGDELAARLTSDGNYRTYFAYGVAGHDVDVRSRNNVSGDCLLRGYRGRGLERIRLKYTNVESTRAGAYDAVPDCVLLGPADTRPATFRDIRIELDVRYPDSGAPARAFACAKYDGEGRPDMFDRGHRIEQLRISGSVQGRGGASSIPLDSVGVWGIGDRFEDWLIHDLRLQDTQAATLDLTPLVGMGELRNVTSDERIYLRAGPG
ncbi:MAG: hypothetical protein ACREK1_05645, partial [Longimicrobiales bacterium]